ncbi:ABC transporter substrate-binding protein [Devosia sp. SD17-2]|uniref:ABC transporter substrate-binding protein n=1 Tax=Devosia sp. SD17-2 TaxID=2976459 RepID=UPI0023D84342|nr:ABC transporter substrate-binding protein [Devosia sp. SD17-2]WEJ31650.1 ABC transporter substrate-binding protein [Devosia sp. SD17-2]
MTIRLHRTAFAGLAASLLSITGMVGLAMAQQTTISFFTGNDEATVAVTEQLVADFEAANPDIKVEIEIGPGGTERDNMVKTRLATGSMNDVFLYNSGSLFQAINPAQSLVDLTNEPWQAEVQNSFKLVVTAPDGTVRGAPIQNAMGGGFFYNIPIYEELGLSIPKSWAEFMANSEKIKAAGKAAPVIQTYTDTWTSQVLFLGDYYNVQSKDPEFANRYTAGEAKFATDPGGIRSFEKLAELSAAGYLNEDYGAAVLADGLRMIALGEGAHYPMLTFGLATVAQNYPDNVEDVGFFAIPGDDPADNGLTIWLPNGIYIPAASTNQEAAKRFVAFVASQEGCASQVKGGAVTGPFLVNGCELPADVPRGVADMLPYFEAGNTAPALEFLSPIKGPALEQITVEIGSGTRSAADGAALYDEDVRKQAQQLGLPGW